MCIPLTVRAHSRVPASTRDTREYIRARGFIFSQTQMIGVIAPRVASSDQYLQNYLRDRIDR